MRIQNLGYDANLRKCINKSTGDYIVLSGNDDIFADESINVINDKLEKYKPSVLLRSYKSFYKKITKSTKFNIHRYVSKDTLVKVDKK